jgi:hypothetical protein
VKEKMSKIITDKMGKMLMLLARKRCLKGKNKKRGWKSG